MKVEKRLGYPILLKEDLEKTLSENLIWDIVLKLQMLLLKPH